MTTAREIFDFPVRRVPTFTEIDGQRITLDKDAIIRMDTITPIGTVSAAEIHRPTADGKMAKLSRDYYQVVEHAEVVNAARKAVKDLGMKAKETTFLSGKGAKLFHQFDFPNNGIEVRKGDWITMRLTVRNSYDLSSNVGFDLGGMRQVCTNGLVAFRRAFFEMRKHSGSFDLDKIMENMKKATETFHMEVSGFYRLMGKTPLEVAIGVKLIQDLVEKKVMPEKYGLAVQAVWEDPDAANSVIPATDVTGRVIAGQFEHVMQDTRLDRARTVWALYNAFTLILTHYITSMERRMLIHQAVQSKIAGLVKK